MEIPRENTVIITPAFEVPKGPNCNIRPATRYGHHHQCKFLAEGPWAGKWCEMFHGTPQEIREKDKPYRWERLKACLDAEAAAKQPTMTPANADASTNALSASPSPSKPPSPAKYLVGYMLTEWLSKYPPSDSYETIGRGDAKSQTFKMYLRNLRTYDEIILMECAIS